MPRCLQDHDIAAARQRPGLVEGAEPLPFEVDEFRFPPCRPAVRKIALRAPGDPAGALELSSRDPHASSRYVVQSARMIGVEVGEDDVADVKETDASCAQLRAEFLVRMHRKADGSSIERMPARVIAPLLHTRGFAGVDEDGGLRRAR